MSSSKRNSQAGFSLAELIVSLFVVVLMLVMILLIFDSTSKLARAQTYIADVQQNVRFAQDEMVEIITGDRMRRARRLRLLDLGDLTVYPLDWARTEVALREAIAKIAARGALPVILGGDQLVTAPHVQGFAAAVRERTGRSIGYVQFSSQLDLGEDLVGDAVGVGR